MSRPQWEVADVIRIHGERFLALHGSSLSLDQRKVLSRVAVCRTAALGGHLYACTAGCGHEEISYNSCRDRHCPKCQGSSSATWFRAREEDLLPVPYFHVTCTLPHRLNRIALQNKEVLYDLLLTTSADALKKTAAKPRPLGAKIGLFGILHTWGQVMLDHLHVHWVVPGGGISLDGSRWIPSRKDSKGDDYLVPKNVVADIFRAKFLDGLRAAFDSGKLTFHGSIADLKDPRSFRRFLRSLGKKSKKRWVVDMRPPFAGPRAVLKYLARYTHRVAISNHRILQVDHSGVTFRYKDYAHGGQQKSMHLSGPEFLRRFLLHVLPKRFVRIRHFGLLAHRDRKANLERCRQLIAEAGVLPEESVPPSVSETESVSDECDVEAEKSELDEKTARRICPQCKQGRMVRTRELAPQDPSTIPTSLAPALERAPP